jgi:hypothetical protein
MLDNEPLCDPAYAIQVAVEMDDPDQMRDFLLAFGKLEKGGPLFG